MDPSTSPVQSTPNIQPPVGSRALPPAAVVQSENMSQTAPNTVGQSIPTPQPISGHPEQAPLQTSAPVENSQEDPEEDQPARQEVSTRPTQSVAEVQEIEVTPSVPEIAVEKSIEHVVEKSPDAEKPQLSDEVKAVGVTHSGPGVAVDENVFSVKTLPMTYDQAVAEEKLHPQLNDSKHWLSELVQYVWRKLDPTNGKKKEVKN